MDDKKGDWEVKNMVNELTRGKELVGQLQIHLMNNGPPSSWHEAHEFLIIRILTSYEKVLTWATSIGDLQDHQTSTGVKIRMLESPPLPTEISSSGESESEHEQSLKDTSRKRSISIRDLQDEANIEMSESTLSCAESLGQSRHQQHSFKKRVKTDVGLVDLHQDKDNHTWRKYGQKPSLGHNHRREYFKCVDRRGCSGRKQVQQSDKDPTKFTIKYNGKHTCTQASHNNNVCPSPSSADQRQQSQVDTTLSLSCATISVVTQDYKDNPRQQTFSSFHPASSSSDVTHSFVSPEISGTSYLSVAEAVMDDSICPNLNPEMGLQGSLDDGFSWRKYGQKDILGAKYPRGYYRCTHRNVQGCLATKQVQRSDEDPTIFEITYRGRHTCTQASSNIVAPSPSSQADQRQQPQTNQQLQTLSNLSTSLTQDVEHFLWDE